MTSNKLKVVDRKDIPNDFYLPYPFNYNKTKQDWKEIQMFNFDNGLTYYIGCFIPIRETYEAVRVLSNELYIISQFNSPEEYQQYYHNHYEWYISLEDCEKLYNYYYYNKELIIEVINEYKELYD
jgi:hypothetical protein